MWTRFADINSAVSADVLNDIPSPPVPPRVRAAREKAKAEAEAEAAAQAAAAAILSASTSTLAADEQDEQQQLLTPADAILSVYVDVDAEGDISLVFVDDVATEAETASTSLTAVVVHDQVDEAKKESLSSTSTSTTTTSSSIASSLLPSPSSPSSLPPALCTSASSAYKSSVRALLDAIVLRLREDPDHEVASIAQDTLTTWELLHPKPSPARSATHSAAYLPLPIAQPLAAPFGYSKDGTPRPEPPRPPTSYSYAPGWSFDKFPVPSPCTVTDFVTDTVSVDPPEVEQLVLSSSFRQQLDAILEVRIAFHHSHPSFCLYCLRLPWYLLRFA